MEKKIVITGLGGQGAKAAGELLCYTAASMADMYATCLPDYGREMRGGKSDCYVVISDEPVNAPKFVHGDYEVALNTATIEESVKKLRAGCVFFANTDSVSEDKIPEGVKVVCVNAREHAHSFGNMKGMNLIMLGALIGYSDLFPADAVMDVIYKKLGAKHPEFNAGNEQAFTCGLKIGRQAKES